MILIADSGSTKTDWALCAERGSNIKGEAACVRIKTQGLNPFYLQNEEIINVLQNELFPQISNSISTIEEVYFYGAGCTETKIPMMEATISEALTRFTSEGKVRVVSVAGDLLAAARAACGREAGIACILGTGANSGLYDGKQIVKNIPPLGFILGDEGSGAVLGKLFLNAIFKEQLPTRVKEAFLTETHQTYADIIDRVYRQPLPNRYLASISKFIRQHLDEFALHSIVEQNFDAFFKNNIMRYDYSRNYPIAVVGSVGKIYEDILKKCADKQGYKLINVLAAPMEGLIKYHIGT